MDIWHITIVTHNSRVSERMIAYRVKHGEGVFLDAVGELIVTKAMADAVREDDIPIHAYAVCGDHVHMLLQADEDRVPKIVGKLKAQSARAYFDQKGMHYTTEQGLMSPCSQTRGTTPGGRRTRGHLWAQKFNHRLIRSDEQYAHTLAYIRYNRTKHGLPHNDTLQQLIDSMTVSNTIEF